ncbi:hypothetical protein AV545_19530 [Paenibacillus jamilae]|uniref:3-oxoacyl-ACP synthase III family protein n=1 Tax=Paenibacillus jamilae TaxID=114136 RepID=UPI0007AB63E3|nr:3-oxoacyl-[acyl-carrier-protein] synthase III C-terminal domain-containing protein [Paenibacillus jamilae]KZE71025.1 hypothetical protein AV545_19530 [Paenibacillus jamilae]
MSTSSYGIRGFGQALGQKRKVEDEVHKYTSNIDKVKKWGYEYFYAAAPEVSQTDLAFQAAEEALNHAGITAEELDFIILAISEIPEYLYWDPACELQHRLGAHSSEAILFNQACSGGLMAFDTAAGKFAIHPDYQYGLVVTSNRNSEEYRNRVTYNSCFHSDGASAAVVQREHPHCRWVSTKIWSDGTYAPLFRYDWGGSTEPFNPVNLQHIHSFSPLAKVQDFFDADPVKLMEFIELLNKRIRLVTEQACEQEGIQLTEIRRIIYLHDNVKSMQEIAEIFEVDIDRTNAKLATQYGHMGVTDQLFDFKQYIESGELNRNDYVALIGIGNGMHWVCSLFQV